MRKVYVVCLLLMFACKPLHRQGNKLDSSLHSVSDGWVTLGVVPVAGDTGLNGYALLMCKNKRPSSLRSFTDDRYCRPALLTGNGEQAVFIPDQMKGHDGSINYRNMVTKAAIFMGVAGISIIGGKYALKALGKNTDKTFTFTRNLDRLAKKSRVEKEVLDYNSAVKKLEMAKAKGRPTKVLETFQNAATEKRDILESAMYIDSGFAARRALNSFNIQLNKLSKKASPADIKNAFAKHIEAEKAKATAIHDKLVKIIHHDAESTLVSQHERLLKALDRVDNELLKFNANDASLDVAKAKDSVASAKSELDDSLNQALDEHAGLLQKRKFNFASIQINTNTALDAVGYGATGAGATLLLANTVAPNLFVKHPHGAAGDSTLRSSWQKVFIFQDYGFSRVHKVKSIEMLLRKIATELNLQVNPRIASW